MQQFLGKAFFFHFQTYLTYIFELKPISLLLGIKIWVTNLKSYVSKPDAVTEKPKYNPKGFNLSSISNTCWKKLIIVQIFKLRTSVNMEYFSAVQLFPLLS